eukprot:306577_1
MKSRQKATIKASLNKRQSYTRLLGKRNDYKSWNQIAYYKKEEHVLIKHGIYRVLRHPSYFGFFYWSIGTQLLLTNPMSTVIYTLASWQFFADRIPFEEQQLVNFCGYEYKEYRRRTMVGIPFIQ